MPVGTAEPNDTPRIPIPMNAPGTPLPLAAGMGFTRRGEAPGIPSP
ncbi:hypothetical protein MMM2322_02751 [Microbacterium sp. MM2322]